MTPAEYHATKIKAAIAEARAAGVNVTLDWDYDDLTDSTSVSMFTTVHRRDENGIMQWIDGPFVVEGY